MVNGEYVSFSYDLRNNFSMISFNRIGVNRLENENISSRFSQNLI